MTLILTIILILSTVVISVEDFRSREVHLILLFVFGVNVILLSLTLHDFREVLINLLSNALLLAYMSAGIWLWLKFVKKTGSKEIGKYFGSGDMLFLLFLMPLFGLKEYLLFMLIAIVASLLWWSVYKLLKKRDSSIPFIGTSGIVLCIYLIGLIEW